MKIEKLPVKVLEECFERTTNGRLKWRDRPLSHFLDVHAWRIFNGKFAGNLVPDTRYSKGKRAPVALAITMKGERIVIQLHHVLWVLFYKTYPTRRVVHVDGNVWNNKINNLIEGWKKGDHIVKAK